MPAVSPVGAADEAAFSYPAGLQAPRGISLPVGSTAPPALALPDCRYPASPPGLLLPEEGASGSDDLSESDSESTSSGTGCSKSSGTSDREETEFEAEEGFHTQLKANASCFVPSFVPRQMEANARMRDDMHCFVPGLPSNTLSSEATQGLQKMPVRATLREAIDQFGSPHEAVAINDKGNKNHNKIRVAHPDTASGVADLGVASGLASGSPRSRQIRDMCFAEQIKIALVHLNGTDDCQHEWALQWVSELFGPLAEDTEGCRLLQKAIEVGTPVYLLQLLGNLRGHVKKLAQSLHGNCILQTFIEMVPSNQIQFVMAEMQGSILFMARHCLGCHSLECLLKHCKPWQTDPMIKKVLTDKASLCRHEFGNLILQCILQYGSAIQRSAVADVVVADIISLSAHRYASQVVSCALAHCSPVDVERITHALLHDKRQLHNLSRKGHGSFVVQEVKRAACLQ